MRERLEPGRAMWENLRHHGKNFIRDTSEVVRFTSYSALMALRLSERVSRMSTGTADADGSDQSSFLSSD